MVIYALATVFLILLKENGADFSPRTACPIATALGWQCSSDCTKLGYCDGISWTPSYSCSNGQLCVDGTCGNYASCPTETVVTSVWCSDPSLKMPNLDDPECKTYYSCTARTNSEIGFGRPETCPVGTTFDHCSGKCTFGEGCNLLYTDPPCGFTAEHRRILTSNVRLAYTCTARYTLWTTCSDGYYMDYGYGPDCYEGLVYGCINGNGEGNGDGDTGDISDNSSSSDDDDGTCKTVGLQAVPGNTCVYLICSFDGSSTQFSCNAGYYFDKQTKRCEKGDCIES